jgi:uncharacterized membrane protein YbaN (DUF454 family)
LVRPWVVVVVSIVMGVIVTLVVSIGMIPSRMTRTRTVMARSWTSGRRRPRILRWVVRRRKTARRRMTRIRGWVARRRNATRRRSDAS